MKVIAIGTFLSFFVEDRRLWLQGPDFPVLNEQDMFLHNMVKFSKYQFILEAVSPGNFLHPRSSCASQHYKYVLAFSQSAQ